jgi:hypothetical protein
MFATKATYAIAALGLAFATPALADYGNSAGRASAQRMRVDQANRNANASWFYQLRQEELGRGPAYGKPNKPGRPGKPGKGPGQGPGKGPKPGHGHPCGKHDSCHTSPG